MIDDRIYDEAAAWLVRQSGDAMDWDGFTLWLEANPDRRLAFNELALVDWELDQYSERLLASPPSPARLSNKERWRWWGGFGGAAIAAGLAFLTLLQPARHRLPVELYRSEPGKSLVVALDSGRVLLAPESMLKVEGANLELQGTAYFDIMHKQGRSLTISAGDFKLVDIGTRFAVANESDGVDVAVAQGSLSIASDRLAKPIDLTKGQELRAGRSSGIVRIITVNPQEIATWRSGKLEFDQVPLALVARDLSRYSGERITVDPAIAGQPFSGVIAIGHGEAPARTLAEILSLRVRQTDRAVRLEPRRS